MSADIISYNDSKQFIGGIKTWQNLGVNSIKTNSLNLNGGNISNVNLINGHDFKELAQNKENYIIFAPGQSNNTFPVYNNLVDVTIHLNRVYGACTLYIDNRAQSPVIFDRDLNGWGKLVVKPYRRNADSMSCTVLDGVQFFNFAEIEGPIAFNCECTSESVFIFDNGAIFILSFGALISTVDYSTISPILIPDDYFVAITSNFNGEYSNAPSPAVPIISAGNNCIVIYQYMNGGQALTSTALAAPNTSDLLFVFDDTVNGYTATFPDFLGPITYRALSLAAGEAYDDSVGLPLGSNNVQSAIDNIKNGYLPLSGGTLSGDLHVNANLDSLTVRIFNQPGQMRSAPDPNILDPNVYTFFDKWNDVTYEYDITFDSGVFTVHTEGKYLVTFSMSFDNFDFGRFCSGYVEVKNTGLRRGWTQSLANGSESVWVNSVSQFYLYPDDMLMVWLYQNSSSPIGINGDPVYKASIEISKLS